MLFCPICGGPIRPPAPSTGESWSDEIKWQTKAVLLSDPDGEFETVEQHYVGGKRSGIAQLHTNFDAVILQERATATWSNTCIYEESGHEISPYWMAGYDEFGAPYNVPYSIATHEACVQIAQMVMRRSQNNVHVRSMRTLWKVLRSRRDARDNEYMVTVQEAGPQYIVMDHGYYMPPGYADDYSLGNGDDTHWVRRSSKILRGGED